MSVVSDLAQSADFDNLVPGFPVKYGVSSFYSTKLDVADVDTLQGQLTALETATTDNTTNVAGLQATDALIQGEITDLKTTDNDLALLLINHLSLIGTNTGNINTNLNNINSNDNEILVLQNKTQNITASTGETEFAGSIL